MSQPYNVKNFRDRFHLRHFFESMIRSYLALLRDCYRWPRTKQRIGYSWKGWLLHRMLGSRNEAKILVFLLRCLD